MTRPRKTPPKISDAEEARIAAGIAHDPDNPEMTEAEFAAMKPASEMLPPALFKALTRPRGRPKADATKVPVKLRLDPAALDWFKRKGPGWQTRMNTFLGANATVLKLIDENEDLLDDMESMLGYLKTGELRAVFEPPEATIAQVQRNIVNVRETVRALREQFADSFLDLTKNPPC